MPPTVSRMRSVPICLDDHPSNFGLFQIKFFTYIAQTYGNNPHVMYEPFNEPLQVSWDSVKAYHKTIVDVIRKYDPDNVIILGTTTWSQDVDIAANSPLTGYKNLMYTCHYYAATHKQDLRNKVTTAINKGQRIMQMANWAMAKIQMMNGHFQVCPYSSLNTVW